MTQAGHSSAAKGRPAIAHCADRMNERIIPAIRRFGEEICMLPDGWMKALSSSLPC
jgi:hypothetical protein